MSRSRLPLRAVLAAVAAAAAALPAGAQDSKDLSALKKAFDAPASPADRIAAVEKVAAAGAKPGAEALLKALGSTLGREEAAAKDLAALRDEDAALQAEFDANGGSLSEEKQARRAALQKSEAEVEERAEGERHVEEALRDGLARCTDPKAIEWLANSGLRGSFPGPARAAAADAVGLSGSADPAVLRGVRSVLRDRDPEVREAALRALARLRPREDDALKELAAGLADARWTVRVGAARRLAEFATPGAVDLLVARLPQESGREARILADLLGSLTGQRFGTEPTGWAQWWRTNRAAYVSGEMVFTPGAAPPLRSDRREGATYYGIPVESRRILFVVDVSGSMNEAGGRDPKKSKLDEAVKELLRCVRTLDGESAFGVFVYGDAVRRWKPGIVKVSDPVRAEIKAWAEGLVAASWTNTYAALEEGLGISAANPGNNMGEDYALVPDTIYLLTDGAPTDARGRLQDAKGRPETDRVLEAVRAWNREKRVAIHCIGVGPQVNETFLATLATENDGIYVRVK